jgi:hypothetical protein
MALRGTKREDEYKLKCISCAVQTVTQFWVLIFISSVGKMFLCIRYEWHMFNVKIND